MTRMPRCDMMFWRIRPGVYTMYVCIPFHGQDVRGWKFPKMHLCMYTLSQPGRQGVAVPKDASVLGVYTEAKTFVVKKLLWRMCSFFFQYNLLSVRVL